LADFFGRGFEIRRARGSALAASVLAGVEGASLMNFARSKPAQCAGVEHNPMTIAPQTRGNELCPLWESTTLMTRLGRIYIRKLQKQEDEEEAGVEEE
jgi:hypothetical protein